MKKLDWKSFAIGVLLTTTVMLGTGAATSTTEKWDANQKWSLLVEQPGQLGSWGSKSGRKRMVGYEPFAAANGVVYLRKPVEDWP